MALNFRGAEAVVKEILWADKPAISKFRNPRGYRHPDLEGTPQSRQVRPETGKI